MADTTHADPAIRELALEPGGLLEINLSSSGLRLRGTLEDRVVVRARDGRDLAADLAIEARPGAVTIRDHAAGAVRFGPLSLQAGHPVDIDVDLPRAARVAVRTLSGDVEASGIGGASRWATTSGDLRLRLDAGPVAVETVSGDVMIEGMAALALAARSVSGDVRVRAVRLDGIEASTTSGDVALDAALAEGVDHEVSSVSGDVRIATGSDVRLASRTLTGDVRASGPHRVEGERGNRTIVIGSGRVRLAVLTMSGDVLLEPAAAGSRPAHGAPPSADRASEPASGPHAGPSQEPEPAPDVEPGPHAGPSQEPEPAPDVEPGIVVAEASAAPNLIRPTTPARGQTDTETGAVVGSGGESSVDRLEAGRLDVLRALERGDVDVDEAARRLELLDNPGPGSMEEQA
jgi:hypothetical protein